jgi:arylsulfatase A-like enzyme
LLANTSFGARELIQFNFQEGGEGGHAATGFIIIVGKNIKRNYVIQNVRPVDIVPTILYLLGGKIPKNMDGRVLEYAIEENYLKEHPITYITNEEHGYLSQANFTSENEVIERIKKTMREVGYIK